MTELTQEFEHFHTWVNMASSWLTRRGPNARAICIDAKGRVCRIGKDFMRARDEGAFPVRWLWPDDVVALAAKPAPTPGAHTELVAALEAVEPVHNNEGYLTLEPVGMSVAAWIEKRDAALASPRSSQQPAKIEREFVNELGNRIKITIEGPTSISENILTPREFYELCSTLRSSQEPPGCPTPGACSCLPHPDPAEEIARLKEALQDIIDNEPATR